MRRRGGWKFSNEAHRGMIDDRGWTERPARLRRTPTKLSRESSSRSVLKTSPELLGGFDPVHTPDRAAADHDARRRDRRLLPRRAVPLLLLFDEDDDATRDPASAGSRRRASTSRGGLRLNIRVVVVRRSDARAARRAVSYTHLTLPTILRV